MSDDKERIVAAAVAMNGLVCYMPPPARHHNILHALHALREEIVHGVSGDKQGFVTSNGRYVTRKEGMEIAKAAGQIGTPIATQLFSEDLW